MNRFTFVQRCVLISAMLMGTGLFSAVMAQTIKKEGERAPEGRQSSQRAFVDPQTGKLREPTEEEAKALTDAMNKQYGRTGEVKMTYHANGMVSAELPADFREVMVIKINPDGTLTEECVTGVKNAEALVQEWGKVEATPTAKKTKTAGKARLTSTRKVARKETVR